MYSGVEKPRKLAVRAVRQILDKFCDGSLEQLLVGWWRTKSWIGPNFSSWLERSHRVLLQKRDAGRRLPLKIRRTSQERTDYVGSLGRCSPFDRSCWRFRPLWFCGSCEAGERPPCSTRSGRLLCTACWHCSRLDRMLPRLPLRILDDRRARTGDRPAASVDGLILPTGGTRQLTAATAEASPPDRLERRHDLRIRRHRICIPGALRDGDVPGPKAAGERSFHFVRRLESRVRIGSHRGPGDGGLAAAEDTAPAGMAGLGPEKLEAVLDSRRRARPPARRSGGGARGAEQVRILVPSAGVDAGAQARAAGGTGLR